MTIKPLLLLSLLSLFALACTEDNSTSSRQKTCINTSWQFHLGNPEANFFQADFDDSEWTDVSVPHTLQLTSLTLDMCDDDKTQPTFQRNVGWYRRNIHVTDNKNKKIYLEFEGAHQVTDCWVNGKHVGQFAVSGYSPFDFDISDFVHRGKSNQVTLMVDNKRNETIPPDPGPFDYVKFSGLYRDVFLVEKSPVHITFNWEAEKAGVYITTPTVDPVNKNAIIDIKTVVRNETSTSVNCKIVNRVIDHRGVVVLKLQKSANISAQQNCEFSQIGAMEDDVQLWDIDNPYLYRVSTQIIVDGSVVDEVENNLGIRKFYLDNERGFILNNKPIDLIGFNRHQHYAYIGDALPNALHYKDMLQFKDLGFNMVRTAHYPQDNALIDACDKLGILVYEEAPTWIGTPKNDLWWDNLEESARRMVRNHRNHPSIVIWGGGINHRGYVPRVNLAVKQEDPTRLTASQGARWTGWQSSGLTDINANMLYGPFIWDRSEPMFAMEGHGGSATVAIHKKDPKMAGILSWTAHAYHTFHPTHDKYQSKTDRTRGGAMTIFRQLKDTEKELSWYPSEMKAEPYLHIADDWSPAIKTLRVYSNADEVAIYVNDVFYKKQKPSDNQEYDGLDHAPFHFEIKSFNSGELKAIAYKAGEVMLEQSIFTPQAPVALQIRVDKKGRTFMADGADIMVAYAQVVDANGTLIKDFEGNVKFTIEGEGCIVGDDVDINANPMFVEFGEAPVLIRSTCLPGTMTLHAHCGDLKSSSVAFASAAKDNNMINNAPIYDFEKLRVDLGAPDQILQFGWTEWSNVDKESSETTLDFLGGINASIKPNSTVGVLRWLGEMNVIGKYGYAYGEGVLGIDPEGFTLQFKNLPQGTYKLKSWHHAPITNTDHMDTNVDKIKSLSIPKIPYANELQISVGNVVSEIKTTHGKAMQFEEAAVAETTFESDGINPVNVIFKDKKSEKGIWLNAFEISQWSRTIN